MAAPFLYGECAMSDPITELFNQALGLPSPWRVEHVRFERAVQEIHFDVVCNAKRLPCSRCAAPDQPIHDGLPSDWQHLPFFQFRVMIHARLPRVRWAVCADKGDSAVHQVAAPWARERSALRRIRRRLAGGTPVQIVFDHAMGGGANRFRGTLTADIVRAGGAVMQVCPDLPQLNYRVRLLSAGRDVETSVPAQDRVLALLAPARIEAIHLNELVSFDDPLAIVDWVRQRAEAGVRCVTYLHDFFAACPVWTLIDERGDYCGIPALERCRECLPNNPAPFLAFHPALDITAWRAGWARLLAVSDLVAFSRASAEILERAYPQLDAARIAVRPHRLDPLPSRRVRPCLDPPLAVAIVGHINLPKGARVVRRMAELIARDNLPMRLHVFGSIEQVAPDAVVSIHGPYATEQLPELLERHRIGVGLLPSICPETYSFVTAELMALGLPLAVFDLGAPAERVRAYSLGAIIPETSAEAALATLQTLWRRLAGMPSAAPLS